MSDWKKVVITWVTATLVGFYGVFVLMQLWNWFAVPLLHAPEGSYWLIYGMNMIFGLLTAHVDNPAHERRWSSLFIILDACVPDHKMETVREDVRSETESIWSDVGLMIFARVFTNTVTLGLGFVVHMLA